MYNDEIIKIGLAGAVALGVFVAGHTVNEWLLAYFTKRRIDDDKARSYINEEYIDEENKNLIKDRLNLESFYQATQVRAKNNYERKKLIIFYEKYKNCFGWPSIRMAYPAHLDVVDGEIKVKVTISHRYEHYFFTSCALMIVCLGAALLMLTIDKGNVAFATAVIAMPFLMALAAVVSYLDAPYRVARKIEQSIILTEENSQDN